ncbi:MAG: aminotransferase class I/II-fold pyridoxal phosphate-dependent enzyme [Candidatus Brocadiaceae bacterium]|jgi:aspartate/methionine/tyrosine aminotransferase
MPLLQTLSREQLLARQRELRTTYADLESRHLSLDMTRGRPCPEQLDLSAGLSECVGPDSYAAADGNDCRNYGDLKGLPEARELLAGYLRVAPDEIIVADNSSLRLIHDTIARCITHGPPGGEERWSDLPVARFLCPCPGYDRHFAVLEHFGVEMIPVPMREDGPDMDAVEERARMDELVRGIICVPRYSNPTGVTYSAETVERLAHMSALPEFRIFWDNAYAVHHLTDAPPELRSITDACRAAGCPDRPILFGSTSKVTFAGAGVAMIASSRRNLEQIAGHLRVQTIGPNKLNQLRHVRFLRNMEGIEAHMRKHAAILRPKFAAVQRTLHEHLAGKGVAEWTDPDGGYFVSFDTVDGCAAEVVRMAGAAGVRLTRAGATFPYGDDPRDRNIRIAPTLPSAPEVEQAMEVLATCAELAAVEKLLEH